MAKGANPQNACILPILAIIGNWIGNKIPIFFAALLQKNYKVILFHHKSISNLAPKRQLRDQGRRLSLQILAIIGNWIGNKIPIFFAALLQKNYKLFYSIINLSVILPHRCNCWAARA